MSVISIEQEKTLFQYWQNTSPGMQNVISSLKLAYQITHFSYERLYPGKQLILLTTHPEFSELFIKRKFYKFAFTGNVQDYTNGYYLFDTFPKNEISQAQREINLDHCLVIVKKQRSFCEMFYFGTSKENDWMNNFYLNNLDLLENFICHFKDRCSSLIARAEKQRLLYPPDSTDKILLSNQAKKCIQYIKNPFLLGKENCSTQPLILTPREKECILYLKIALTAKQIGRQMNISPRTVEKHIINLKQKFSCRSKLELMMKLIHFRKIYN